MKFKEHLRFLLNNFSSRKEFTPKQALSKWKIHNIPKATETHVRMDLYRLWKMNFLYKKRNPLRYKIKNRAVKYLLVVGKDNIPTKKELILERDFYKHLALDWASPGHKKMLFEDFINKLEVPRILKHSKLFIKKKMAGLQKKCDLPFDPNMFKNQ